MNLRHVSGITRYRASLTEMAEKCGCQRHFVDYEVVGKGRAYIRNHLVLTFIFPEETGRVLHFLAYIKRAPKICLESVGYDNCTFTLLYASKGYLNMLDKQKATEYRKARVKLKEGPFRYVVEASSGGS